MKNSHTSSLPANTKSLRAVLPSLLGLQLERAAFFGDPARRVCCECWNTLEMLHVPSPALAEGQHVGSAGLGQEVRGGMCASAWGSVHGFWQEVIEVT